ISTSCATTTATESGLLGLARARKPLRRLLELRPALDGGLELCLDVLERTKPRLDLLARPLVVVGLRHSPFELGRLVLEALDLVRQRIELPLQLVRKLLRRRVLLSHRLRFGRR